MDEKGDSGALATCLRVMSRVQQQFYEQGARPRGWGGRAAAACWCTESVSWLLL